MLHFCFSGKLITKVITSIESWMPCIVLIRHLLDQSRFPDDLKNNLLKEIARMDKPNVEVLLNKFRLCQKMQGSRVVRILLSTMLMLVRVWVAVNV